MLPWRMQLKENATFKIWQLEKSQTLRQVQNILNTHWNDFRKIQKEPLLFSFY